MVECRGEIVLLGDHALAFVFRAKNHKSKPSRAAIVLNNAFWGFIDIPFPAKGLTAELRFALPTHLLASTIDLIDPATGLSMLEEPYELTAYLGIEIEPFERAGLAISGAFTIQPQMDPVLFVQLVHDGRPLGGTFAHLSKPNATAGLRYEFAMPLPSLWPLAQASHLSLRIGGCDVTGGRTLPIDAQLLGVVGYVDRAEHDTIEGWAVNLADPTRRPRIELLHHGRVVATRTADGVRRDLQAAGIGDGRAGFSFTVPPAQRDKPAPHYAVRLAGTQTHLINSPCALQAVARVIGYFDEVQGGIIVGWVCDLDNPDTPLIVDVHCDGQVLATDVAGGIRGDVVNAGIPIAKCGFRINLGSQFRPNLGRSISVRVRGHTHDLAGSPKLLEQNPNITRFLNRQTRIDSFKLRRIRRRLNHRLDGAAISIVMPIYNTPKAWLAEALESVRAQWCDNWELICVNDHSTEPHVAEMLSIYARHDRRFRVLTTEKNVGIARATNFGIRAAVHPFITFMDHDDTLEPDAVYSLVAAAVQTGADFLYSDEVVTYEDIDSIMEVRARPAFSHDYYLSHPYFVHMLCMRADLARQIGGWDETMAISADVDFALRAIEVARTIAHIPAVLYRWRTHPHSAGHARQSQVMEATRGALQRHLDRRGVPARVSDGVFFNQFRLDWPHDDGKILIIIPTKNKGDLLKTCVESIEKTCKGAEYQIVVIDHDSVERESRRIIDRIGQRHTVMPYKGEFNFARMNNVAVRKHGRGAKYVLFLNNDIEAIEKGWLDRLRSLANRSEVGVVGPLLLYGDKRVQHAGVIIGFNNAAEHALKFVDYLVEGGERRNLGYNCALTSVRDYSAVTGACMMMRREVFESVGGFDEIFAVGFNDTDLCLRLVKLGYKILYDGQTVLYHHESATRSETSQVAHPKDDGLLRRRWKRYFTEGDPFYNPNLDLRMHDHTLRNDVACKVLPPARMTTLVVEAAKPASRRRKTA
jgi:GT2 family glycosyltransferase